MIEVLAASWALGMLGSLHCVAMCGGIVGALSSGVAPNLRKRPAVHVGYVLAYSVGRVASYALLGAVAGAFGWGVSLALGHAQLVLRFIAGVLVLVFGLRLAGLRTGTSWLERVGERLWRKVRPRMSGLLPVRTLRAALLLGALWGFIPCAMVYAALGVALAAGGPVRASLSMAAFGLGTMPALALAGTVSGHILAGAGRAVVRRAGGLLVAALAIVMLATSIPARDPHAGASCHSEQSAVAP